VTKDQIAAWELGQQEIPEVVLLEMRDLFAVSVPFILGTETPSEPTTTVWLHRQSVSGSSP
jgi:hypothetical protein